MAGDFVKGFGGGGSEVTALAAGNQLANLERDFLTATRAGDDSVNASLLAVRDLRRRRREDADALLGRDATAQLLRQATGKFVSPTYIGEQARRRATAALDRQARGAAGFGRTASEFVFRGYEGTGIPFLGSAANTAAAEGSDSAQAIVAELRQTNQLLQRVAGNTDDRNRRPSVAQRDAATTAARRRSQ